MLHEPYRDEPEPTMKPIKQQLSFASAEFAMKKRVTRRERFLADMERVCPSSRWVAVIEPEYPKGPKSGQAGRPPIGLERMLRMYCIQQWFGLSDEGVEDAIVDSQALRHFVGIDLAREAVPDATTLLKFRRKLEDKKLTESMFEEVKALLSQKGLLMREGTMVDATIIAAPPSTKNKEQARDPERHQTKKGNNWHFGMKAHIDADTDSGVVHSLKVTAANESDVAHTVDVLHGQESTVYADAGYQGVDKRDEVTKAQTDGTLQANITWHIAAKRSPIKKMADGPLKDLVQQIERAKAQVRARVEHPFHVVKNLFKHKKARYKGLAKNEAQLFSLFGLANLVLAKSRLMALDTRGAS
jgi:transposase, IS5 family